MRCNALQRAATRCNALQRAATHSALTSAASAQRATRFLTGLTRAAPASCLHPAVALCLCTATARSGRSGDQTALTTFVAKAGATFASASKDNATVYYESAPEVALLPPLEPKVLAKGVAVAPLLEKASDGALPAAVLPTPPSPSARPLESGGVAVCSLFCRLGAEFKPVPFAERRAAEAEMARERERLGVRSSPPSHPRVPLPRILSPPLPPPLGASHPRRVTLRLAAPRRATPRPPRRAAHPPGNA